MAIITWFLGNAATLSIAVAVGAFTAIILFLARFYHKWMQMPPGPVPLPIVGTSLHFRGNQNLLPFLKVLKLANVYGPVFTIFSRSSPSVVVTDPHVVLEVLKKHTFAGRIQTKVTQMFLYDAGSTDVLRSDFNPEWEVLRKVAHSALRKYAAGNELPVMVARVMDQVLEEIHSKEEGKAFDVVKYLAPLLTALLGSAAFGKDYRLNDKELLDWLNVHSIVIKHSRKMRWMLKLPFLRFVWPSAFNQLKNAFAYRRSFAKKKYEQHVASFDGVNIRDFTDALLMAKKEAEEEDSQSQMFLKPENIRNSILLLFSAGSSTTRVALHWSFLFLANDFSKQQRIREEIESVVGLEDIPTLEHRNRCVYTCAFLSEVLRFRTLTPLNVPHKAMIDTQIQGHSIKEGTEIHTSLYHCLNDLDTWGDPDVFRPERFIDEEGNFLSKPNLYYIPFSAGRRGCPGNKLALANMFFIIARFIQKTRGKRIELEKGVGSVNLSGDPKAPGIWMPSSFQIKLTSQCE